jgi:hypothetical protein
MEEIYAADCDEIFCCGCGWECGFPSCHVLHSGGGCKILRDKYLIEVKVDENEDPFFHLVEKKTGKELPNIYF